MQLVRCSPVLGTDGPTRDPHPHVSDRCVTLFVVVSGRGTKTKSQSPPPSLFVIFTSAGCRGVETGTHLCIRCAN